MITDDHLLFWLTGKIHFLLTYSQPCPLAKLNSTGFFFIFFLHDDLKYLNVVILTPLDFFFSKVHIPNSFKEGMAWFLLHITLTHQRAFAT